MGSKNCLDKRSQYNTGKLRARARYFSGFWLRFAFHFFSIFGIKISEEQINLTDYVLVKFLLNIKTPTSGCRVGSYL